jgi:outer membrane protein OmpA-like peptidoglycan-associated protein
MKNGMFLCAALVVGTLACAHEPKKTESPVGAAPSTAQPQPSRHPSRLVRAPARRTPTAETNNSAYDRNVSTSRPTWPSAARCASTSNSIKPTWRRTTPVKLQRMGRCLKADHALHVTIEGNADERGTEDWNLALGDKRASAVEDYLERLGVSTDSAQEG